MECFLPGHLWKESTIVVLWLTSLMNCVLNRLKIASVVLKSKTEKIGSVFELKLGKFPETIPNITWNRIHGIDITLITTGICIMN